jgi:hypothetical protein
LLVQWKESNQELNKLLKLEKKRNKKLDLELAQARRLSLVSKAQVVLFKTHMMSYKKLIKILKCNFMLFGQAHPSPQMILKYLLEKYVY